MPPFLRALEEENAGVCENLVVSTTELPRLEPVTDADRKVITEQLGRPPRALRAVAARCPSGHPSVVQTSPRLENGTPFPTLYYLTCPRLSSMVGRLEASGIMREMTDHLRPVPIEFVAIRLRTRYHDLPILILSRI